MLANGKVQDPENFTFQLTDVNGTTRKFRFASVTSIAGRVDDYIVPLRAGSMYTVRLSSQNFHTPAMDSGSIPPLLSPCKCTITAGFIGDGAKAANLDTPGLRLLNFWSGKLRSNVLKVDN